MTFETLITILTIENFISCQSLLPDNSEWHWTACAILAMFTSTCTLMMRDRPSLTGSSLQFHRCGNARPWWSCFLQTLSGHSYPLSSPKVLIMQWSGFSSMCSWCFVKAVLCLRSKWGRKTQLHHKTRLAKGMMVHDPEAQRTKTFQTGAFQAQ